MQVSVPLATAATCLAQVCYPVFAANIVNGTFIQYFQNIRYITESTYVSKTEKAKLPGNNYFQAEREVGDIYSYTS